VNPIVRRLADATRLLARILRGIHRRHVMPDEPTGRDRGEFRAAPATAEPIAPARSKPIASAPQADTGTATRQETTVQDWSKPAAKAIPKGGFYPDKVEQGRYGPIFPKTPACYGFSIIVKVIRGREENFYEYARTIEKAVAETPDVLGALKLHYLRWNLFPINGDTYFQYMGIFDTDFDKYTEDAVSLFAATGLSTAFENLEGFPRDWKTNAPAFVQFVREHHYPPFLEYGEYPYVSAEEIKKALRLKDSFEAMLDQMQ